MTIEQFWIFFSVLYISALFFMISHFHFKADRKSFYAILNQTTDDSIRRIRSSPVYDLFDCMREVEWDWRGFDLWRRSKYKH